MLQLSVTGISLMKYTFYVITVCPFATRGKDHTPVNAQAALLRSGKLQQSCGNNRALLLVGDQHLDGPAGN